MTGAHAHAHGGHGHSHAAHGHGHSHGLVDPSIKRSRAGLKAVLLSLLILGATAGLQIAVFVLSGSVALLADLIHNVGDALTAIPLGAAFLMRSAVAEKYAGYFVVATIFISACVAFAESIDRLVHPQDLTHLWALAGAGIIGFLGNEAAALVRLRAGARLQSPALVADGNHARIDGIVSLAVLASAAFVALGLPIADPLIGLAVTAIILRITWQSFRTVHAAHQHRSPVRAANCARNAGAEVGRRERWGGARDALWGFVAPHLLDGARVAVVGAGNGDDLSLRRLSARAGSVTLIDIDPIAARSARRRLPWRLRRRVQVIEHDVTEGAADHIVHTAMSPESRGCQADHSQPGSDRNPRPAPLPGVPYDLAIGDLLYTQLLYPALVDSGVPEDRTADVLRRHALALTQATVARLHASAPTVVHIHDPLAWWDGHEQPIALDAILRLAASEGTDAALDLVAQGIGPTESDPRTALASLAIPPQATTLYPWPFSPGVDYLACATLA
jgi:Co/Zn/Cd efflux system component